MVKKQYLLQQKFLETKYDMGQKIIITFNQYFSLNRPVVFFKHLMLTLISGVLLSACSGMSEIDQEIIEKITVKKSAVEIALEKPVILLLSSDSHVYTGVADEIKKQSRRKFISYQLTGDHQDDLTIINKIQLEKSDQVVAIGLSAAKVAGKFKAKQVVFSQVFNYQDHALVRSWMKGVDVLPSSSRLFEDWKQLEPRLSKVVIITGNNMTPYVEQAKQAARRQKIQLIHYEVSNDKEFLYTSKNLSKDIQGHWIIPDNRILSMNVLREALSFNAREGKHTVVFSPSLLSFGGLFYVHATEQEISRQIDRRLQKSAGRKVIPGQDVAPLMSHQMGINETVAKRLGIVIPQPFQKYIE